MQEFVEAFVGAGKLAGALGMDQGDAFHPALDLFVIPSIAPHAHQVFGELQAHAERFLVCPAADGTRRLLELLHGNLTRREFLQNLRHALGFVALDKRLL